MAAQTTEPEHKPSKPSRKCLKLLQIYNKYFPRDRETYIVKMPVLGLILSFFALHFVTSIFDDRGMQGFALFLVWCGYSFAAGSVGYGLYYGLKTGVPKQCTNWILLKFIELLLVFASIIYGWIDGNFYLVITYGFIILGTYERDLSCCTW